MDEYICVFCGHGVPDKLVCHECGDYKGVVRSDERPKKEPRMHCYPWVLVKAESREDAIKAASEWLDGEFEGSCPYDYGKVVAEEGTDEEDKAESVIPGGSDKFRGVVKAAIETEHRVLREHWDVTKAFVNSFDEPPPGFMSGSKEQFKAKYKIGWGLGPGDLVKAGTEVDQTIPAWQGYYQAGKLDKIRSHMDGRDAVLTPDAALYDLREDDGKCDPIEAGEECWLVLLDCHF
jgi:hypothetical protein